MRLKKELKINFRTIKKFVIAILFLSSLQIFLSVFGYFPFFKRLNFSIGLLFLEDSQVTVFSFISALKIAILIGAGFFIFLKNKFNLKQIFLISILLLSASILSLLLTDRLFSGLPSLFKILNFLNLLVKNFILTFIFCSMGGLICETYKKIKKDIKI